MLVRWQTMKVITDAEDERYANQMYYHSDKVWRRGPERRDSLVPDVRRQSQEDAANYVFLNDMDKQRFYMTQYPEINEPSNLTRYEDRCEKNLLYYGFRGFGQLNPGLSRESACLALKPL